MLPGSLSKIQPQFVLGLVVGLTVAFLLQTPLRLSFTIAPTSSGPNYTSNSINLLQTRAGQRDSILKEGAFEGDGDETMTPVENFKDDDSVAHNLYERVRVLCWIMTAPKFLYTKAIHVRNTWGPRCNVLLFISSIPDNDFPAIGLNVTEGRTHLPEKTMKAFSYIYDHHFHDADWFMKADDDTYVIMENLRYFLSTQDSDKPVYFGHIFKNTTKRQGFPSGGGGYVLSKEALMRFGETGRYDLELCQTDVGAEDVKMGRCMTNLGVILESSVDSLGKSRFHCFTVDVMIGQNFPIWYQGYDLGRESGGMENISDYAISFHHVPPDSMYAMEFCTYHLRPYGISPPSYR